MPLILQLYTLYCKEASVGKKKLKVFGKWRSASRRNEARRGSKKNGNSRVFFLTGWRKRAILIHNEMADVLYETKESAGFQSEGSGFFKMRRTAEL
jgi:hypothetical protein